jgi:hypothetical protein
MQGIRLAFGVVERAHLGIQQVSRVTLLRRRVEHIRRGRMRRAGAFAAAEEVSDHIWQWAHSSMEACSWVLAIGERAVVDLAGSNSATTLMTHGSQSAPADLRGAMGNEAALREASRRESEAW